MSYQITVYGDHQFDLKYEDKELLEIIEKYICDKKTHGEMYFTYYTLCRFILYKAKEDNKLEGVDSNTYYESPNISQKELTRISRLLWDLILDRKIFVDFSNNAYMAHIGGNDTVIGIREGVGYGRR